MNLDEKYFDTIWNVDVEKLGLVILIKGIPCSSAAGETFIATNYTNLHEWLCENG